MDKVRAKTAIMSAKVAAGPVFKADKVAFLPMPWRPEAPGPECTHMHALSGTASIEITQKIT